MAQLLYDEEGHPTQFSIDYALFYDDKAEPYKTMTLGWDGQKYDWDPSSIRYVTYNGHRVPIGTRWTKDFSIATGLMLSEAQMDEQGLDKTDHERYPEYIYGTNEKYYILESVGLIGSQKNIKRASETVKALYDKRKAKRVIVETVAYQAVLKTVFANI